MFLAGAAAGALIATTIVGMAWLLHHERTARKAIERQVAALEIELANLTRVRQNRLYRERLEDVGFAASQGALRVAALRSQMEEELRIIEAILARRTQQ